VKSKVSAIGRHLPSLAWLGNRPREAYIGCSLAIFTVIASRVLTFAARKLYPLITFSQIRDLICDEEMLDLTCQGNRDSNDRDSKNTIAKGRSVFVKFCCNHRHFGKREVTMLGHAFFVFVFVISALVCLGAAVPRANNNPF